MTSNEAGAGVRLQLDPQQLETVLARVHVKSGGFSASDALALMQTIVLALGGCWVAFQTFSVRAEQERTALRTLKKQDEQLDWTLKRTQERRFHLDTRAKIQKLESKGDDAVYYVEYAYLPENTSDVKIRFQFAVIDLYLGTRNSAVTATNVIFPINGPLQKAGAVSWQHLATQVFQDRSADAWAKKVIDRLTTTPKRSFSFEEEGAELANGESARFIRPYIVTAKKGTWLGFVLSYGVDNEERWTTDYYDLEYESNQALAPILPLSNTR